MIVANDESLRTDNYSIAAGSTSTPQTDAVFGGITAFLDNTAY